MSITILDGGMGQELITRAKTPPTGLWAVQALLDDPDMVRAVHDDYFASGAEVATTNTYNVLHDRFETHGIMDRLEEITRLSCGIAVKARDAHGGGQVLGSLGPLGFSYQPDKAPPSEQAAEAYAELARWHADYVDVHICETMASVDQAKGAILGASVTGKPIWVSLTVDDRDGSKLRSGEAITDVLPLLKEHKVAAVLVNCSKPEAVTQALPHLVGHGMPVGAYANGFTSIADAFNHIGATADILETRKDLGPAAYADFADQWVNDGATLIGGCCEVGPKHIAELKKRFKE